MAEKVVLVLAGCRPEAESLTRTEAKGLRVQNPASDVHVSIRTQEIGDSFGSKV
jgi:hypothetical protein